MGKNGVCQVRLYDLASTLNFKKYILLFDKVYIPNLEYLLPYTRKQYDYLDDEEVEVLRENRKVFEFLHKQGIIVSYDQQAMDIYDPFSKRNKYGKDQNGNPRYSYEPSLSSADLANRIENVKVRLHSHKLSSIHNQDFFPILNSTSSLLEGTDKKTNVLQFILNGIPQPDMNVQWEHIVEFKSDADVMNKYYALINWINKVSASSASVSDIEDEYRSLYSDYMLAFKLHKMKHSSKSLAIFVTVADNFTSSLLRGKIFSAIHGLLDIRTAKVTLMEEERKLPGKEIAYIYHADQKFGNQ